jgi:hypothetical protein
MPWNSPEEGRILFEESKLARTGFSAPVFVAQAPMKTIESQPLSRIPSRTTGDIGACHYRGRREAIKTGP